MCSVRDRKILTIYEYFIHTGEVPYLKAILDLQNRGVKLTAFGYGVESFLIAMRKDRQLECRASDGVAGGVCRITQRGKDEYEGWKSVAGVS
jgi:hypothetical protein